MLVFGSNVNTRGRHNTARRHQPRRPRLPAMPPQEPRSWSAEPLLTTPSSPKNTCRHPRSDFLHWAGAWRAEVELARPGAACCQLLPCDSFLAVHPPPPPIILPPPPSNPHLACHPPHFHHTCRRLFLPPLLTLKALPSFPFRSPTHHDTPPGLIYTCYCLVPLGSRVTFWWCL